jgi:hypothetical protein
MNPPRYSGSSAAKKKSSGNSSSGSSTRRKTGSGTTTQKRNKQGSSTSVKKPSVASETSTRKLERLEARRRRRERELRREQRILQRRETEMQILGQGTSQGEWELIPNDPPSYDEFAAPEGSIGSPPYRDRLHKHYDLLSFDPRFSTPILRINRSLVKSSTKLERSMWKLKGFNILPDEVNLWKVRQVDDRNLYNVLPQLLSDEPANESGNREDQQLDEAMYLSMIENNRSGEFTSSCAREQEPHLFKAFNGFTSTT